MCFPWSQVAFWAHRFTPHALSLAKEAPGGVVLVYNAGEEPAFFVCYLCRCPSSFLLHCLCHPSHHPPNQQPQQQAKSSPLYRNTTPSTTHTNTGTTGLHSRGSSDPAVHAKLEAEYKATLEAVFG